MFGTIDPSIRAVLATYDSKRPLEYSSTIPSAWYTNPVVAYLEKSAVFGPSWQVVGRVDQLTERGSYITANVADEPIVVIRGDDDCIRGFHNVCRHHAAAVATGEQGCVSVLRCPYHGWTYGLDGTLRGTPEFQGVRDFDKRDNGLVPIATEVWGPFVCVRVDPRGMEITGWLGDLPQRVEPLNLIALHFFERRSYTLDCNWKVFVDNYLDGGYHVPFAHKNLNSVLDYAGYTIKNGDRYCLQSSPIAGGSGDSRTASVRRGEMAYYYWIYPNFMINWYEGVMDTNLALPLGVDRTQVIFDFYFSDVSPAAEAHNRQSVEVAHQVQMEDVAVCESVQRGLKSRAYDTGRLSVRREAGEHLFHRLLHADLTRSVAEQG